MLWSSVGAALGCTTALHNGFYWEHSDDFGSPAKQARLGSPFVLPDGDDGLD